MRDSKNKKRETNGSDGNNSGSLQMELELLAIKAKNADLVNAHTRLLQENSELKNQMFSLQADLVDIQAKYNNLESLFKNVEQNMKKCTPNLIDVLNLFLQVTDSRKNSCNMLNMSDRVSDRGFIPKAKAITHTVKPHTVNGTVLNLVPTISLTRLSTTNANQILNEVSCTSRNLDYRNSLPSTSTSNNMENHEENMNPNLDTSEENQSFVSRRRNTTLTPEVSRNGPFDLAEEDDVEAEEQLSDESSEEEENVSRLSTIQEESLCSSGRKRTSLGEVRIYLSRLSAEDMQARRSQNTSFGSTDANVSDTCLNIETTVIENPENRVSKRLRADIMVFSPHTNSTRMENDDSRFTDLSPRSEQGNISISAVQSTEVTPNLTPNQTVCGNDGPVTFNRMTWLPTPSMSALGDIDSSNCSKLEILGELELTPSPSDRADSRKDRTKLSPMPPSATPQRHTRSKIKTRSNCRSDDDSPKNSFENQDRKRSVRTFVNRQRGASDDRPLTPTIVLERLENILPEHRLTASSVNIQFLTQSDEPKENENPPNKMGKPRKTKAKTSSKSAKSVKRKMNHEEEPETIVLQEKIREIQIRLSNYVPETSENDVESPKDNGRRPARAARPKNLKDSSLKGKLRRMF